MRRRSGTKCASLSPLHAGMSYARLEAEGGLQWPCYDENHPGEMFLAQPALGAAAERPEGRLPSGRARPAGGAAYGRVSAAADHRPPARRVQYGSANIGLRVAAAPRREPRHFAGRRGTTGGQRRRGRARLVPGAGGSRCRCGLTRGCVRAYVHDASLPGRGRDEHPDDRRHGPEVGDGGIQGRRHPGRAAGSHLRQWTFISTAPNRPRPSKPPWIPFWDRRPPAWAGGPRNVEEEGHSSLLGGHAARSRRDLLLPALHAVQSRLAGSPRVPSTTSAGA